MLSIFQLNVIHPVAIVRVKLKSEHLIRGQTTVIDVAKQISQIYLRLLVNDKSIRSRLF